MACAFGLDRRVVGEREEAHQKREDDDDVAYELDHGNPKSGVAQHVKQCTCQDLSSDKTTSWNAFRDLAVNSLDSFRRLSTDFSA